MTEIVKQSNEAADYSGSYLGTQGLIALKEVNGKIYENARKELRWPQAYRTYTEMMFDPTISAAINFHKDIISNTECGFVAGSDKAKSKTATDFLNWCIQNLDEQLFRHVIHEYCSSFEYGFAILEKIFKKVDKGQWKGKYRIAQFAPRSQSSVYKWDIKDGVLYGFEQSYPSGKVAVDSATATKYLKRNKFLLFRQNVKDNNPEGQSLLHPCYNPWKFKQNIEEYEMIGISKDLGGIPVIGIDVDFLARAEANPSGNEAKVVQRMSRDAANLHAGEQAFVIRPLAYTDSGKDRFTFELQGITGSGKQFSTDTIIRRKQNEILTALHADVLKLGQDGSGSFALSSNKSTLLWMEQEAMRKEFADVINKELIPQLLAINGWTFREEDMPRFEFGKAVEPDLDILSKFYQRVAAVGLITPDQSLEQHLRDISNSPENSYTDPIPDSFKTESKSRSGDGMASGLNNGTSGNDVDDADAGNLES